MRIRERSLLLLVACGVGFAAHAQDPPRYALKERQPMTGSFIARNTVNSSIPFDRRYDQLAPEHKALLRSQYVDMKPEDEPPFPVEGLGKMLEIMYEGARKGRTLRGEIYLIVHVDRTGEATSVEVLRAPDERWTRFAAGVAMLTKYKPAVCNGAPCAMEYAVRFQLSGR